MGRAHPRLCLEKRRSDRAARDSYCGITQGSTGFGEDQHVQGKDGHREIVCKHEGWIRPLHIEQEASQRRIRSYTQQVLILISWDSISTTRYQSQLHDSMALEFVRCRPQLLRKCHGTCCHHYLESFRTQTPFL